MYRTYLKTCLNKDKLKEINRNSPKNTKYCNGLSTVGYQCTKINFKYKIDF